MRIGICDDNAMDAKKIVFALSDISPGMEITCFQTGGALLDAGKKDPPFDLVFLDIFLKQENGMAIAEQLRQFSPNTEIVFSTTSRDYAVEAFQMRAADYLIKPYTEADVLKAFARANVNYKHKKQEGVLLQVSGETFFFLPTDVIRIESDGHYTNLTDLKGRITRIHLGYSEVASQFPETFTELRRGRCVNMAHISELKGDAVTLTDGSTHIIARAKQDKVIADFARYLSDARTQSKVR